LHPGYWGICGILDSPGSRRIHIPTVRVRMQECVSNINISNMWPKKSRASGSIHLPRGIPEDGVGSRESENGETVKERGGGAFIQSFVSLSLSLFTFPITGCCLLVCIACLDSCTVVSRFYPSVRFPAYTHKTFFFLILLFFSIIFFLILFSVLFFPIRRGGPCG